MSKEDGEKWRDEPIPPPEKRATPAWPLHIGDPSQPGLSGEGWMPPVLRVDGNVLVTGILRVIMQIWTAFLVADEADIYERLGLRNTGAGTPDAETTLSASASSCNVYVKSQKLVIQVNQGTAETPDLHYFYLDLMGTSGTWTHTTSAP